LADLTKTAKITRTQLKISRVSGDRIMDSETKEEKFTRICKDELGLEVRPYSGRGMYGRSCPAVEVDDEEGYQDLIIATGMRLKIDNLGLGYIVYTG
jgi:hypothetical protein